MNESVGGKWSLSGLAMAIIKQRSILIKYACFFHLLELSPNHLFQVSPFSSPFQFFAEIWEGALICFSPGVYGPLISWYNSFGKGPIWAWWWSRCYNELVLSLALLWGQMNTILERENARGREWRVHCGVVGHINKVGKLKRWWKDPQRKLDGDRPEYACLIAFPKIWRKCQQKILALIRKGEGVEGPLCL